MKSAVDRERDDRRAARISSPLPGASRASALRVLGLAFTVSECRFFPAVVNSMKNSFLALVIVAASWLSNGLSSAQEIETSPVLDACATASKAAQFECFDQQGSSAESCMESSQRVLRMCLDTEPGLAEAIEAALADAEGVAVAVDGAKSGSRRGECRYFCDEEGEQDAGRDSDEGYNEDRIAQRRPPVERQPMPPQRPPMQVAQACMTMAGACPMQVAIPVNSPCHCRTPYGVFAGIAR